MASLGTAVSAHAQDRLSLIRDAEIEHIVRSMATPIFQAAGLSPQSVDIYLVNDRDINAFVMGGQNLFLNTGLFIQAESAEELIGVIAHEAGHIAGGHLVIGQDMAERAERNALITLLAGVAAGLASGDAGAGVGAALSGQSMVQRSMLAFTRRMEAQADQAALTFLDRAGISADGLRTFLGRMADQELLPATSQDEYIQTHPITATRIDTVRNHVATSPYTGQPLPAGMTEQFERIRAKIVGYLAPGRALQMYPDSDTSIAARYGRAIAHYQLGRLDQALAIMSGLLDAEPNNPFFHEWTGQMLFEHGRLAEARQYFDQANRLLPGEPLIMIALARTQLNSGTDADLQAAVQNLQGAAARPGGDMALTFRLLATAQGRLGNMGASALALAEEGLALGDAQQAISQAQRALQTLAVGTPSYLRAQDVLREAERLADER